MEASPVRASPAPVTSRLSQVLYQPLKSVVTQEKMKAKPISDILPRPFSLGIQEPNPTGQELSLLTPDKRADVYRQLQFLIRKDELNGSITENEAEELAEMYFSLGIYTNVPGLNLMYPFEGSDMASDLKAVDRLLKVIPGADQTLVMLVPMGKEELVQEARALHPNRNIASIPHSEGFIDSTIVGQSHLIVHHVDGVLRTHPKWTKSSFFGIPPQIQNRDNIKGSYLNRTMIIGIFDDGFARVKLFGKGALGMMDEIKKVFFRLKFA